MKNFVCTREMAVDGTYIYPSIYEIENTEDYILVKNAQGNYNVNLIMTEEECNSCGYFTV